MARRILITGAAGFIGSHTARRLLNEGNEVVGFDNLNDYYDPELKRARIATLTDAPNFEFIENDLLNKAALSSAAKNAEIVIHLAAQPGIRYSLQNPDAYIQSNIVGFMNLLEVCRETKPKHLVYASSSSVYGGNRDMPYHEAQSVDTPVSLYAATKKSNELMAHVYSHLFKLPTTGLRFFTVYGPWGRPDMMPFLFTRSILAGEPIKVFNHGHMKRDFTYVDDIVDGILAVATRPPTSQPPYAIFNIGRSEPAELLEFIALLEENLGCKAITELLPIQPGDVEATYADTSALSTWTGISPKVSLAEGVSKFVAWYRNYYSE
ncbi:NAD-dependent epimerase [soil metagenome]